MEQRRDPLSLARRIVEIATDHKAEEPVVMDMRPISTETDVFIVLTAQSRQHAHSLSKYIREALRKEGVRPVTVEGETAARWICLDCGSVWVHIFTADLRGYYDLEDLWRDAPRLDVESGLARPA